MASEPGGTIPLTRRKFITLQTIRVIIVRKRFFNRVKTGKTIVGYSARDYSYCPRELNKWYYQVVHA